MINKSFSVKIETLLLMAISMAICFLCLNAEKYALPGNDAVRMLSVWPVICVLGLIIVSDSIRNIIPNRCVLAILLIWGIEKLYAGLNMTVYLLNRVGAGTDRPAGRYASDVIFVWETAGNVISGLVIALIALTASFIIRKAVRRKALGGGDIKLLFALGLFLGFGRSITMLFLACIFGLATALFTAGKGRYGHFPFGPAISLAYIITAFCF